MREVIGNLLAADEVAIGHGVNTKGLMGAGIAKAIRTAYPQISGAYIEWCKTAQGGDVFTYKISDERYIVNIASQELPGADARYEWVATGVAKAVNDLVALGIHKLALPRIGAGIGGLDWQAVKIIIKLIELVYLNNGVDFEFVIYTLPDPSVNGQAALPTAKEQV